MAGLIQKAVTSLFVSDSDTSRVRDNLVSAVNPVLTFLTSNFAQNSTILSVLKPIVGTIGSFTGAMGVGSLTVNGTSSLKGNVTILPTAINGVVITPAVAGAVFYITNVAGNQVMFVVNADGSVSTVGTISANSFSSTQGFKSYIPLGTHWRQTGQSGVQRTVETVFRTDTSVAQYANCNRPMPQAGSIVGISMFLNNSIAADVTVQVYKNNASGTTGQIIDTAGVKANATVPAAPITFAKGAYPFAAGDYLGMGCYVGSGYSFSSVFGITVEFGA